MTQAFNLSQFANKVNTSGQADLTTAVTGTLPVGNGGTGITTTPSNGQIPIGNGSNYTAATLTQGTGITITNASGAITIAASSSAPTTAQVQTAISGSNAGDLGTWGTFRNVTSGTTWSPGNNFAGSSLYWSAISSQGGSSTAGGSPSGTWKATSYSSGVGPMQATFFRIA